MSNIIRFLGGGGRGVTMLCLEYCFIWRRDLDTKKIGVKVFGELQNMMLEENEDKIIRESN